MVKQIMIQHYSAARPLSLSNFKRGAKYVKCPSCGQLRLKLYCYEDGRPESEILGRCQREANCGYHLKPKDYFKDKGENYSNLPTFKKVEPLPTYSIPTEVCEPFIANYKNGTLYQFLCKTGLDFSDVFERYKVGATKNESIVFFQFDGIKFRTGKIIKYLPNGHRDKSNGLPADWMHNKVSVIDREKEELRQCFFGWHLIKESETVCIVESEKTALICAKLFGGSVWLATGGRTQLQAAKLHQLAKKNVFLFPDSDSVEFWREKVKPFGNCRIVDLSALNIDGRKGADLGDYLLEMGADVQKECYLTINKILK